MNAGPGGKCSRCGGPNWWTIVRGKLWVACKGECTDDQIDIFGRNPPLIALCAEPEETPKVAGGNLNEEGG